MKPVHLKHIISFDPLENNGPNKDTLKGTLTFQKDKEEGKYRFDGF